MKTNAAFLARCLAELGFIAGHFDTGFIAARLPTIAQKPEPSLSDALLALGRHGRNDDAWATPWADERAWGLRMNAPSAAAWRIFVDGEVREAEFHPSAGESSFSAARVNDQVVLFADGAAFAVSQQADLEHLSAEADDGCVRAPMPGRIVQVNIQAGQAVAAGQTLLVLEAMKMEHALAARSAGVVTELSCQEGDQVSEGAALVELRADGDH